MTFTNEKVINTSSCTICGTYASGCGPCSDHRPTKQDVVAFFSKANWKPLIALLFCIWCLISSTNLIPPPLAPISNLFLPTQKPDLQSCAWKTLKPHISLLDVPPIHRSEFLSRQKTLAKKLHEEKADYYLTEPSASSTYYFNISTSYGLSERPFLSILSSSGEFSYLAPRFELGRISRLEMVTGKKGKKVIEWREEQDPFAVLGKELGIEKENGKRKKVVVDDQTRFFVVAGLEKAGFDVFSVSQEIASIRSVKTAAELKILRGINEFTINVVRSLQPCIHIGISQEEILDAAKGLFTKASLGREFWAIVLFGSQAANPHGGDDHGKKLPDGEFLLIDIGSKLHGYGSDVTRTILPPSSKPSAQLLDFWNLVLASQTAAIAHMTPNRTCSSVDAASREPYQEKGYEEFYTHRLGHGLGLEIHESPYLNGANGEMLKGGEVVTNEPGFYVTDEQAKIRGWKRGFGVRIEDAVVVAEEGGVVLTGGRARSPWLP